MACWDVLIKCASSCYCRNEFHSFEELISIWRRSGINDLDPLHPVYTGCVINVLCINFSSICFALKIELGDENHMLENCLPGLGCPEV